MVQLDSVQCKKWQARLLELFVLGVYLESMSSSIHLSLAHDVSGLERFAECFRKPLARDHRVDSNHE